MEALVALSVTALAGAVLLLSVETSLDTTTAAVEQTIADGIAQQVLDEILTRRFVSPGTDPLDPALGPTSLELTGPGRTRFDDADDYHGYVMAPLVDEFGLPLGAGDDIGNLRPAAFRLPGGYFANWRLRASVYFVDPSNPAARLEGNTSYYRAVEVEVEYLEPGGAARPLASRKRIIAYIPPPAP